MLQPLEKAMTGQETEIEENIRAELEIFRELEVMGVLKRTGEFHRDSAGELQPVYIAGDLDPDRMGEPADFLQYLREWWRAH